MNQFILKGDCNELLPFKHIIEFASKRNTTIQLHSFTTQQSNCLRFYFISEGKFEWIIDEEPFTLYPNDLVIILPHQVFGGDKNILNIGALSWLCLQAVHNSETNFALDDSWSGLPANEFKAIQRTLLTNRSPVISNAKFALKIFNQLEQEMTGQEIGYTTRVNHLIDELLILCTRQLSRHGNSSHNFPQNFLAVEQVLRNNLAHQWTVEEMAALIGLGNTAFSERVKSYTGFTPLNYLINIRISEAVKLLKRQDVNITDIAFQVGFYSSQHFATTFKKLTGYTPRDFRKNNTTNP